MISQERYIVIYKDSLDSRNLYFGPFTSLTIAERFLADLPTPLAGGNKVYKSFQPYTHDESTLARDVILRKREHGDFLDTAKEIVSGGYQFT